jgi:hypothetical protein
MPVWDCGRAAVIGALAHPEPGLAVPFDLFPMRESPCRAVRDRGFALAEVMVLRQRPARWR